MSEHFKSQFGDVTDISGENKVIKYNMNSFDNLEYECWALIKKYADFFGFKIENAFDSEDDIDFYLAKEVQETILKFFEDAGIKFVNENDSVGLAGN